MARQCSGDMKAVSQQTEREDRKGLCIPAPGSWGAGALQTGVVFAPGRQVYSPLNSHPCGPFLLPGGIVDFLDKTTFWPGLHGSSSLPSFGVSHVKVFSVITRISH